MNPYFYLLFIFIIYSKLIFFLTGLISVGIILVYSFMLFHLGFQSSM